MGVMFLTARFHKLMKPLMQRKKDDCAMSNICWVHSTCQCYASWSIHGVPVNSIMMGALLFSFSIEEPGTQNV